MPTPRRSQTSSRDRPPPRPRRRAAPPRRAPAAVAPPKLMKSLMAVIDKLDIRRAQVQVEAIIVEIDVNKSSNLGVQWLLDGGNNYGYGVTNLPGSGTSIIDLASAVLSATGTTTTIPTTGITT